MKRIITFCICLFAFVSLRAQETAPPDTSAYLKFIRDTTVTSMDINDINDYSMIGVNYGVTLSQMSFNPSQKQSMIFNPVYVSLMYTHYQKLFQYMPYFGWQIGLAYGKEGYQFKKNKETGKVHTIEGASKAVMEVVEIPFLMSLHFDSDNFKVMANAGMYGGYRCSIERSGDNVTAGLERAFADYDRRWDYGLQGGVGFGIVMSPIEFHVNALLRYSWSSIYTPDSSPSIYNQYYYRFAYPFDISITAGIHIQLTKRKGWTTAKLKSKAMEIVENGWDLEIKEQNEKSEDTVETGNAESQDR